MKRGSLLAFTVTALVVAGTVSIYLIGSPEGTFESFGGQIALLVGGVALLAGLIALVVHHFHGDSSQSEEIQNEAGETFRNFTGSLFHLLTGAFLPLWVIWALLLSGLVSERLWATLATLGATAAWAGWLYPRLVRHLHSVWVANHHYNPLRVWLWATHFLVLAAYAAVVSALALQGEIDEAAWLMGLAGLIGFGAAWRWMRGISIETFLVAVIITAWVIPVILALNFALDFKGPEKVEQVTYRECLNEARTPPWELAERFQACRILPYGTNLDVRAELTHWRGGLGFRWRQAKRLD